MDLVKRMNVAINYIEEHLLENIDYEDVARLAETSNFHFQRMFSFVTGMSIAEYVRRRRLTLAAFELQRTELNIIDIAFKYGYDSHESFTRAFQKLHDIPPSYAKKEGCSLKAYPKLTFHLSIIGDVEMNYRIEKKPAFKMFGIEKIINMKDEQNFIEIPKFWNECMNNGSADKLTDASGFKMKPGYVGLMPVNGIMCYKDTGKDTFPYLIGCLMPKNGVSGDYEIVDIPDLNWAIFTTPPYTNDKLTNGIQDEWKRIFSEWFPSSGYEHANGPELEMYYIGKGNTEYCEIWIPIIKK